MAGPGALETPRVSQTGWGFRWLRGCGEGAHWWSVEGRGHVVLLQPLRTLLFTLRAAETQPPLDPLRSPSELPTPLLTNLTWECQVPVAPHLWTLGRLGLGAL